MATRSPTLVWSAVLVGAWLVAAGGASVASAQQAPELVFDPTWPKDLPNLWKLGGITGLARRPRRQRLGLQPAERPHEHRAACGARPAARSVLHACAFDDSPRSHRPRHRLVRCAARSRHGRRQRRLRVPRPRHRAQIRSALRPRGGGDRARARARRRRPRRLADDQQPPAGARRTRPRRGVPAAARARRRGGRSAGRTPRRISREVSAHYAGGRRPARRNSHRRGRQRGLRRRQLLRRPRARVRARHVRVQARLGRLRQAARGHQRRRSRPPLHAERPDAAATSSAT